MKSMKKLTRLFAAVATLACAAALAIPALAFADGNAEADTGCQSEGCGHVAAIGSAHYGDLHDAMVAAKSGETVLLIDDVDLSGVEWEPVSFSGKFDGQNHKIINLTINKPGVSKTGFIASLNGVFENVTFIDPTVIGGENTGVVAGRAGGDAALAKNITVSGTIKVETTHSGYARAGVIVGGWGYGKYENITVDGTDAETSYVKHTGGGDGRYVAGIVGHADGVDAYTNCTVKNITISSEDGWLCGAIAGPGPASTTTSGCVVENVVINSTYSGGMFGWYYGSGTIMDCVVKNVVFAKSHAKNGAIGGYGTNGSAVVKNITVENVSNADGTTELLSFGASIAKGEDTYYYADLPTAIAAADSGETVTLLKSASGAGVVIDKSLTIDFAGNAYTFTTPAVGSEGTTTNGFQILKGNDVTLKGGKLEVSENYKEDYYILVQNYADLTVEDMTLDGTNLDRWANDEDQVNNGDSIVLSNNSGTVEIKGETDIIANNEGSKRFAFDVYDYSSAGYAVPTVTVDTTGTIEGKIEVTGGDLVVKQATVTDLAAAISYAAADAKITLAESVSGSGVVFPEKTFTNLVIDFAGNTYTFTEPAVGSKGTESNGFQILKGNSVTLTSSKGQGKLEVSDGVINKETGEKYADLYYILVQNYADLTVEDMILDGTNLDKWSKDVDQENNGDSIALSNNSGIVMIKGKTDITANNEGSKRFAFDVYNSSSYSEKPIVTVETTGVISGKIEVSETIKDNLTIKGGTYTVDPSEYVASGYIAKLGGGNTFTVIKKENLGAGTYTADPNGALAAHCVASANADGTWTVTYVPPAPPAASKPIEVPVEGDSTVKVEAVVEGTKAEVEEITPEQIESVTSGNAAANVTVDFSGLDQAVTEISIPASSVEAIAEAAKDTANSVSGLEVKLPEATVQFDAGALSAVTEAIAEETAGADAPAASDVKVTLVVEAVAVEDLAPAQQEALKGAPNAVVVQATVLVNDRPVHDFNGGLAMVTVPYELPEGADPADVTVWYVSEDGTMEAMQTSYKDGLVTFWAPHFSDYVVTSDEGNAAHVCPSAKFSDFRAGAWYHGPVDWAVMNGVLRGDGNGKDTLRPTGAVTRAEFLAMLYRIEGSPAAEEPCTFSDVKAGDWYEDVMAWAQEAGVIKGDEGKDTVRPKDVITRQEMAVILHRYAQLKGIDVSAAVDLSIFADAAKVSPYAGPALEWAVANGIIGGYTDGSDCLGPKDNAKRAQAAAMLQRLDAAYGIL